MVEKKEDILKEKIELWKEIEKEMPYADFETKRCIFREISLDWRTLMIGEQKAGKSEQPMGEEMATERQKKYLKDLGVLQEEVDKMTKQEAIKAIDKLKPEKKGKGKYF